MKIFEMPKIRTELIDPRNQKIFAAVEELISELNPKLEELVRISAKEFSDNFDYPEYVKIKISESFKKSLDAAIQNKINETAKRYIDSVTMVHSESINQAMFEELKKTLKEQGQQ